MPGVNILGLESGGRRPLPTVTGKAMAVGYTERGETEVYHYVNTPSKAFRLIGSRNAQTARMWDAIESFFRYGGRDLYLVRIVGPGAAKATANLDDASAGSPYSLVATAVGEGTWYNGINIEVEADGADRQILVTHDDDVTVQEASGFKSTQQELVTWALTSRYIRLALGASTNMPPAATYSLAGGDDDFAAIDDDVRVAALDVFDESLGAGQVCIPGATTQASWEGIGAHCEANPRRCGIVAFPDTSDEATLLALAATVRTDGKHLAGFAGWLEEPISGSKTSTKWVSPELAVCGKIAMHDHATLGLGQNKPAAGVGGGGRGVFRTALSVSQQDSDTWKDKEVRNTLNAAGVNLIRWLPEHGATIYGWRSLTDPDDENWVNFGHKRLQMALYVLAESVLEQFVFEEIDPEGRLLGRVNGAVTSQVVHPYYEVGSLYGDTPQEAYRVDTDSVNDDETAAAREVNVAITVVESEFAEEINVYVTKNLISEGVGS